MAHFEFQTSSVIFTEFKDTLDYLVAQSRTLKVGTDVKCVFWQEVAAACEPRHKELRQEKYGL